LAASITSFSFAVYGFNSGHFISRAYDFPIDIVLAADALPSGRALFKQFAACPQICTSSSDLLRCINASKASSTIHGYMIHTHMFQHNVNEKEFWSTQSKIVRSLQSKRGLQTLLVHINSDCDMSHARAFRRSLVRDNWIFSSTDAYYPDYGDSIGAFATFFLAVHKQASQNSGKIICPTPPSKAPMPLAAFIHLPFHSKQFATAPERSHPDFASGNFSSSAPPADAFTAKQYRPMRLYDIHRSFDSKAVTAGAGVYNVDGLCPPFSSPNSNMFASTFGIEFVVGSDTFVRPFCAYEYASCYRMTNDLTYSLSHPENFSLLATGVPVKTGRLLVSSLLSRLDSIRTEGFDLHHPSLSHAPAAVSMVPMYTSGAIGSRLPDNDVWRKALLHDKETKLLLDMIALPSLAESKEHISQLHHVFRQPARSGLFSVKDGILYMKEPFQNDTKFVSLRIVPAALRNIVFVAFHANPIGGHLDAFRTFHRIRQRYFWPGMYLYCKRMIAVCPGCSLSNITQRRSADLVYGFPIDAPINVLFVDIYAAGAEHNFEGNKHYLIAACGMTAFSICEPTPEQNAATFAAALMRIWLRFGFSHTLVVDKDSKFLGVFAETARLLSINIHVLSGGNHNPMIVERVNRFLNASLTIFCNERGTNRVAEEGILMALYAWNSAPVVGTDVSRSLIVVGREFQFPIDFSADHHSILTSTPIGVTNFAKDQATLLSCCRKIAQELISHHRSYHREYINSRRPNPRVYSIGDKVYVRRAVRSDKKRGLVDKLMNAWTGPWKITGKVAGSSYSIEHIDSKRIGKRHASDISPFPPELLPFLPVDGPDNRFGQLHRPIQQSAYQHAGIKGFKPCQPVNLGNAACLATGSPDPDAIHFPTLHELNSELDDWDDSEMASVAGDTSLCIAVEAFAVVPKPPPPVVQPSPPPVPAIADLTASILASSDKLFFIAHRIPGSTVSEWCLVRVALQDSIKQHPSCLQDGRFLVDFYICHSKDKLFNATNQRFWLEYHPIFSPANPLRNRTTHLIRPSAESPQYAAAEGLVPFRQWVRLTNTSTYICGPFDFTSINGRLSRDRVSLPHWKVLHEFQHLFTNSVPSLEMPEYSAHLSFFHETHDDTVISARLAACISAPTSPNSV
jgi:hypothetical protein